jgi:hypothetical protein
MSKRTFAVSCALILGAASAHGQTQISDDALQVLRLESTPIGALPPIALPMPASRNHSYWGARLQSGYRSSRDGDDLGAVAGGIDFQYRGGSVIGVTGGYQRRDCDLVGPDCGAHALFGVRSRINFLTGGPTIGKLFGDVNATTTIGGELGVGYAPNVLPNINSCTFDMGLPLSVSMLQRVRVVTYVTPGLAWDVSCGSEGPETRMSWLTGFGIGIQQFGNRSTDIFLGAQKIFRGDTGFQIGLSVTYVWLR